jgi:hypothetical protein
MPELSFRHDRRQIIVPVAVISPDDVTRIIVADGLLDTGASASGISRRLADQLNLPMVGKRLIATPSGEHMSRFYETRLGFFPDGTAPTGMPYVLDQGFTVLGMETGSRFDILIGMDVLGWRDLTIRADATGILRL